MGAEMTLQELLDIIEPSMPGTEATCSFVEAVRLAHTAIINRLVQVRSDALVQEITVDVAAGEDIGYLPDEFLSLSRRPQIVGGAFLNMLTSNDTSGLETAAVPAFYRVVGKLIQLFPPTAADVTIKMLARMRPDAPAAMYDDLPFTGDFDQIYIDGVIAILSGGLAAMNAKTYVAGIQMQVDQLLSGADGDDEQVLADSINGI
ncbi:hypothetical protein UFOVP1419_46 [uncultured Caudovirales phage]|uniref:Uncharacterized protein n=1 Tax=uncultured Caudovirales phage TaxID=2100421 RepID=A0A6J5SDE4_9CAUD|nr:hypothetical protein UFOVP1419_46 [uncultured Caudovirales phage]